MADTILQEAPGVALAKKKSEMLSDDLRTKLTDAYKAKAEADLAAKMGKAAPVAPAAPTVPAAPAAAPQPAAPTTPAPATPAAPSTPPAPPSYPRSALQWEEWKKAERERVQKEFEERYKTATPQDTEAITRIQKERDDLATRLRTVAIERDPAFEKEFNTATQAVVDMAKTSLGTNSDTGIKILNMQPSEARDTAIEKLMESLPAYKQTQFAYALAEMDKLRNIKSAKIQESVANWNNLQAESNARTEKERQTMTGVFDKTLNEWSDPQKGLAILQPRDGDEAWNARVEETKQLAKDIFSGELEVDELARAAIWAASAKGLLEELGSAQEQLKAKEAEIAQLKGLSPGADGQTGTTATNANADNADEYKGMSYGQIIGAQARKAGIG